MTIIDCKKTTSPPSREEFPQQQCVRLPFLLSILAYCSGRNADRSLHREHCAFQFWVYPKMHPCLVTNLGRRWKARSRGLARRTAARGPRLSPETRHRLRRRFALGGSATAAARAVYTVRPLTPPPPPSLQPSAAADSAAATSSAAA